MIDDPMPPAQGDPFSDLVPPQAPIPDDPFSDLVPQNKPKSAIGHDWTNLASLAKSHGFHVTGANEKTGHNTNSPHYDGRAIDVRTRDKTPEQIAAFIEAANSEGYRVVDERSRPKGQPVWTGPHLHLEVPRNYGGAASPNMKPDLAVANEGEPEPPTPVQGPPSPSFLQQMTQPKSVPKPAPVVPLEQKFRNIGNALVKQAKEDRKKQYDERYGNLPFDVDGFKNALARGLSGVKLKNGQQIRLDQAIEIWQKRTGEAPPTVNAFPDVGGSRGQFTVPQEAVDVGTFMGGKGGTLQDRFKDRAQRGEAQPRSATELLMPVADAAGKLASEVAPYLPMQRERMAVFSGIESALNAVGVDTPKESAAYFRPAITIMAGLLDYPLKSGATFVKSGLTGVARKGVHDSGHMADALIEALNPDSNISFEDRAGTLGMTALAAIGAIHGIDRAKAIVKNKYPELFKVSGWERDLAGMTDAIKSNADLGTAIRREQIRQRMIAEARVKAAEAEGIEPPTQAVADATAPVDAPVAVEPVAPASIPGTKKKPKPPKVEPEPTPAPITDEGPMVPVDVDAPEYNPNGPRKRDWRGDGPDPVETPKAEWEAHHFEETRRSALETNALETEFVTEHGETLGGAKLSAKQRAAELKRLEQERAAWESMTPDTWTETIQDGLGRDHREYVEQNINRGRYVADSVLVDYPDLAERYRKMYEKPEAVAPEPVNESPVTQPETPEPPVQTTPEVEPPVQPTAEVPAPMPEVESGQKKPPHEMSRSDWEAESFAADKAKYVAEAEAEIVRLKAAGHKSTSAEMKAAKQALREARNMEPSVLYADENGMTHEDHVAEAIDRGESVPPEVLAEYPDIQKTLGKKKNPATMERKSTPSVEQAVTPKKTPWFKRAPSKRQVYEIVRDIINVGKTLGVHSFMESNMKAGVAGTYENPSKKYPYGRVRIGDSMHTMTAIDTVAHEVGHAFDSFLTTLYHKKAGKRLPGDKMTIAKGASGDVRVILKAKPGEVAKFQQELIDLTVAIEGADRVNANPEYFLNPKELWARAMEALVGGRRDMLADHAPNVYARLNEMQLEHPELKKLIDIGKGIAIDKTPYKLFGHDFGMLAPDRLQEWIKSLQSRTLGMKAREIEVVHEVNRVRIIHEIGKLMAQKMKGVPDKAEDLFNAAEGILSFDSTTGKMEFGTRRYTMLDEALEDFADQETELLDSGWVRVADGDNGIAVYEQWRVDPFEAQLNFEALSEKGKDVIREFTDDLQNAKDVFNRNYAADYFKIGSTIEGYVHHAADLDKNTGASWGRAVLRERTASARKMRSDEGAFTRDLFGATAKNITELSLEKPYNDMVKKMFAVVAEPLPKGSDPRPGYVKIYGNTKTGWFTQDGKPFMLNNGEAMPLNLLEWEVPKEAYDYFIKDAKAAKDMHLLGQTIEAVLKGWKINALAHPASMATNAISGGRMYAQYILHNMFRDLMEAGTGEFKNRTGKSTMAFLNGFIKRHDESFDWLHGGKHSMYHEQWEQMSGGIGDNPISIKVDELGNKVLSGYGGIERWFKRTISDSERRINEGPDFDIQDPEFLMALNETLDTYTLDYSNVPTWLRTLRSHNLGRSTAPFITYPYKMTKAYTKLIGAAFDPNLPVQERAAKILSLATGIAVQTAVKNWLATQYVQQKTNLPPDENDPESYSNSKLPSSVNAHGWSVISVDENGNEVFAKSSKIPYFQLSDAIDAAMKQDPDALSGIWQDHIGQLHPIGELILGAAGYSDKYSQYKDVGTRIAEWGTSFVPGGRIMSSISKAADPHAREIPKTWDGVFKQMIPFANDLHGEVRAEKVPIYLPGQSRKYAPKDTPRGGVWFEVPKEPLIDTLYREFFGIPIKRVNRAMYERLKQNQVYYDRIPKKPDRPYDPLKPPG